MKKIISMLLILIMVSSTFITAFSVNEKVEVDGYLDVPVIVLSGDGTPIVNKDGELALHYKGLLAEENREKIISILLNGMKNLLYPLIIEGLLTDKWDNFYNTLQTEISKVFEETHLDKNGDIPTDPNSIGYKTDMAPEYYDLMEKALSANYTEDYKYEQETFRFYYDWRLDPFVIAERLHTYIGRVKEATGAEKVGILARCLGTSVVAAYIKVYGMDDITGVAFNGSVVNGAEILSETISGGFEVDMNAIIRILQDSNGLGFIVFDEIVIDVLQMLEKSGFYGIAKETAEATIYKKLVEGVTSALALSTFYTWPTYWTAVAPEDYQDALCYVFGPEGSEKRKEYAGLIEKLDRYDREVRQQLPQIYDTIDREGNLAIMSKYGFQIVPLINSYDKLADQFASVEYTSLGATTMSVYDTFSDEYIAKRVAEGKGKYISPDKKIDASTCLYPEYTWFVKGSSHSNWSFVENALLEEVIIADKQLTVDDTIYTQFMVYDYDTNTMSAMTEENCNNEFYVADKEYDKPQNIFERIKVFIKSVIKLLSTIGTRLFNKISGK